MPEKNEPKRKKSKAAEGTHQIWVSSPMHWALSQKATDDRRTIRITVEEMLVTHVNELGYASMGTLEEAYNAWLKENKSVTQKKDAA